MTLIAVPTIVHTDEAAMPNDTVGIVKVSVLPGDQAGRGFGGSADYRGVKRASRFNAVAEVDEQFGAINWRVGVSYKGAHAKMKSDWRKEKQFHGGKKPCVPASVSKEDLDQMEQRIIEALKATENKKLKSLTKQLARSTDALEASVKHNTPK